MSNQDQLTIVVNAFEQWRKNRNSSTNTTPKPLRRQTVALNNHYSSSRITTALRISGGQFKQWCNEYPSLNEPIDFLELPVTQNPQGDESGECTLKLEISFPRGEKLQLSGQITPNLLATRFKEMRG